MFRSINPANLKSKEKQKLMAALIESNPQKKFFHAGEYDVPAPTAKNPNATRKFTLKSKLVSYPSKKHPGEIRFAVCDDMPINKDHDDKFYSKATIKASKSANGKLNVVSKSKAGKERFVKLVNTADEDVKNAVVQANSFLREISLFGAKELTSEGDWTAQVMHRLPGRPLIDILIDDDKKNMFTAAQRLNLWIMVGEAVINQAHAHGIIHRDIKADNFMVVLDKDNNPVSVILVDYDLAKRKGEKVRFEKAGTKYPVDYRAPEMKNKNKENRYSDEKSDAYSFAKLLSVYGWRDLIDDEKSKYTGLTDEHKELMQQVMKLGMDANTAKRASINTIISTFKAIRAYLPETSASRLSK